MLPLHQRNCGHEWLGASLCRIRTGIFRAIRAGVSGRRLKVEICFADSAFYDAELGALLVTCSYRCMVQDRHQLVKLSGLAGILPIVGKERVTYALRG